MAFRSSSPALLCVMNKLSFLLALFGGVSLWLMLFGGGGGSEVILQYFYI